MNIAIGAAYKAFSDYIDGLSENIFSLASNQSFVDLVNNAESIFETQKVTSFTSKLIRFDLSPGYSAVVSGKFSLKPNSLSQITGIVTGATILQNGVAIVDGSVASDTVTFKAGTSALTLRGSFSNDVASIKDLFSGLMDNGLDLGLNSATYTESGRTVLSMTASQTEITVQIQDWIFTLTGSFHTDIDQYRSAGLFFDLMNGKLSDLDMSASTLVVTNATTGEVALTVTDPEHLLQDEIIINGSDVDGSPYYHYSISGSDGSDLIFGRGGNDYFSSIYSSASNDLIDGGSGTDTVFYDANRSNFSVLTDNSITTVTTLTGPAHTDTLINVERLAFSDRTVNLAFNTPGSGNYLYFESLSAGSTRSFNPATDVLVFLNEPVLAANLSWSPAPDRSSISFTVQNKTITLNADYYQITDSNVIFNSSSKFLVGDNSIGTADDDGNNTLFGDTGYDLLMGLGGDDTLYGRAGGDLLMGGTGNDVLVGGADHDALDGGAGTDVAVFSGKYGDYSIGSSDGVTVTDLRIGSPDGQDRLTNVEILRFSDKVYNLSAGTLSSLSPRMDFDGDGKADLIWQDGSGNLTVWGMDGGVRAREVSIGSTGSTDWKPAGFKDFDGDGNVDVLWRSASNGIMSMWQMADGAVKTVLPVGDPGSTDWQIAGVQDFSGDGKTDILWRSAESGGMSLWRMDGASVAGVTPVGDPGSLDWQVAGMADFNGDGQTDILWRSASQGNMSLWQMSGTTVAAVSPVGDPGSLDWQVAGMADFSGDGQTDILWRSASQGNMSLWQMSGTTVAAVSPVGDPGSTDWQITATDDFTGDGKTDILWRSTSNDHLSLWELDGITVQYVNAISALPQSDWHLA